MNRNNIISIQSLSFIIAIAMILLFSFLQRVDPIYQWQLLPEHHLVAEEPMLSNLDGYYYLQNAFEIQQGTYSKTDNLRAHPDYRQRRSIPPFLSIIIFTASKITGASLNWVAIFIPCVLSLLICIPIILFSLRWGTPVMAILATLLALYAPYYAARNSLGVLDTDCLNATFPLLLAFFSLSIATSTGKRQLIYGLAFFLSYVLFIWWWDQTITVPTILAFGPFFIAAVFIYNPGRKTKTLSLFAISLFLLILILCNIDYAKIVFENITNLFRYISKEQKDLYPNVGISISEQQPLPLTSLGQATGLNIFSIFFAIGGLILLVKDKKQEFFVLLPTFIIGIFALFYALRFTIFLLPFIAIGFGYGAHKLICNSFKKNMFWGYSLMLFFFSYSIYIAVTLNDTGTSRSSFFRAEVILGMQQLQSTTASDSVVWSWWELGHPLVYWSQRATVNDGMVHTSERNYFTALPLATTSDRFSANFMSFYSVRGSRGKNVFIEKVGKYNEIGEDLFIKILKNGPDEINESLPTLPQDVKKSLAKYLFPQEGPPIYLFIADRTVANTHWIHYNGTWNINAQSPLKTLPTLTLSLPNNLLFPELPDSSQISINKNTNMLTLPSFFKEPIYVEKIVATSGTTSISYENKKGSSPYITPHFAQSKAISDENTDTGSYNMDILYGQNILILQDAKRANSIIKRLFYRRNDYDPKYIIPFDLTSQHYKVYRIKNDYIK